MLFLRNRLILCFKSLFRKKSTPCRGVFCHLRADNEIWYCFCLNDFSNMYCSDSMVICFYISFQLRYRHAQHSAIDKNPGNYILIDPAVHTGCQTCWEEIQIITKNKISLQQFSVYKNINTLVFFYQFRSIFKIIPHYVGIGHLIWPLQDKAVFL